MSRTKQKSGNYKFILEPNAKLRQVEAFVGYNFLKTNLLNNLSFLVHNSLGGDNGMQKMS